MTITASDVAVANRAGAVEPRLAQLWEKNLGVAVRNSDDYFLIGGDSLRGTQLLSWIHESFGVELSLLDLFESRTLTAQTQLLLARADDEGMVQAKPATEYRFFGARRLFSALHRPARQFSRRGAPSQNLPAGDFRGHPRS